MGNLELGRFGKKGSVDVNAFKENVKKEQIKDAKMQQIYDAIDSNKDGVIDKKELENFQKSILQLLVMTGYLNVKLRAF